MNSAAMAESVGGGGLLLSQFMKSVGAAGAECLKTMEGSLEQIKALHEKMHKGEVKVDPAKMKKLDKNVKAVSTDVKHMQP